MSDFMSGPYMDMYMAEANARQKYRKKHPEIRGYVNVRTEPKIQPNSLCPCGSGKKYKNCCG